MFKNGKVHDLDYILKQSIGQPIATEMKQKVMKRLEPYANLTQVESVLQKMESAKSEWDIVALDYGIALAASYILNGDRFALPAGTSVRGPTSDLFDMESDSYEGSNKYSRFHF